MKTASEICGLLLAVGLVGGGCSAPRTERQAARSIAAEQFVALTVMSPDPARRSQSNFRLGAGDSLGQAVYDNYISVVRANPTWQYASGESTK